VEPGRVPLRLPLVAGQFQQPQAQLVLAMQALPAWVVASVPAQVVAGWAWLLAAQALLAQALARQSLVLSPPAVLVWAVV
jgi:hypothetical protein